MKTLISPLFLVLNIVIFSWKHLSKDFLLIYRNWQNFFFFFLERYTDIVFGKWLLVNADNVANQSVISPQNKQNSIVS